MRGSRNRGLKELRYWMGSKCECISQWIFEEILSCSYDSIFFWLLSVFLDLIIFLFSSCKWKYSTLFSNLSFCFPPWAWLQNLPKINPALPSALISNFLIAEYKWIYFSSSPWNQHVPKWNHQLSLSAISHFVFIMIYFLFVYLFIWLVVWSYVGFTLLFFSYLVLRCLLLHRLGTIKKVALLFSLIPYIFWLQKVVFTFPRALLLLSALLYYANFMSDMVFTLKNSVYGLFIELPFSDISHCCPSRKPWSGNSLLKSLSKVLSFFYKA